MATSKLDVREPSLDMTSHAPNLNQQRIAAPLPTILCIDDEESGLMLRKMMLEGEGYRVMTCTNGPEGLRILENSPVDVVILDYKMPGMNGAEVAAAIKEKWPTIPIVMLSGYPNAISDDVLAMVSAFVTKGGSPDQLFGVVQDALKGQCARLITILNVDDNVEHRYAISRVLTKAGFTVVEAKTGQEALALASSRPHLIILDVNLPDMLGFEVTKTLKSNPVTNNIPIIQVSATCASEEVAREALRVGADRFIEHTDDLTDVLEAVRDELRKRYPEPTS